MKKLITLLLAAAVLLSLPSAALAAGEDDPVFELYTLEQDVDGIPVEYHIPWISLEGPGAAAVNAAIRSEVYDRYVTGSGYYTEAMGIDFSWAVNGDVLSLLIQVHGMTDNDDYYIYNVSLTDGERLSDRELFTAAGVTRTQFNDMLRTALTRAMDEGPSFDGDSYWQQMRTECLSDDNIGLAKPYMGQGGALCAVAWVYTPAGAGRYLQTLTLVAGDTVEQVAAFLERCDSEYLTEADIAGFDEQMCEYARNGVYARSGRKFQSAELQEYFSQFDWYEPTVEPSQFANSMLNDYQMKNIALVLDYEAAHGY